MRFARRRCRDMPAAFFFWPAFIFFDRIILLPKFVYTEILNMPKFSKSTNSQYTKISKTPIKDLVVVLYVFNLDVVCAPFFYLFIYIYTKSEKGEPMESRYIAFFAALANY